MCARVQKMAQGLVDLNVKPGDRVAILALNCPEYLEAYFFIGWMGAIVVPLNTRLPVAELAGILNDCECSAILCDDAFHKATTELMKQVKSMRHLILIGAKPAGGALESSVSTAMYDELLAKSASMPAPVAASSDAVYGIWFTGGTTGRSKGAMLSHEGLLFNAYGMSLFCRHQVDCRYLHTAPMFHLADGSSTWGITMSGAAHVFVPRFAPDLVLRAIQDHRVTHTMLVPTMFQLILQQPNVSAFDLRSMRYFMYGASPMPEPTLLQAMKTFPGAKFIHGYGMTESSPVLSFLAPEHHYAGSPLLASAGQVVPHGELRIFDENDDEVPRGTVGEIVYRGPNVMLGYWNQPQLTQHALKGGWLHTGDGGKMDANGFVFLVDRIKDMIVTGGENVYSSEVENCVMQIKGVLATAVIGVPDDVLVEKVCCFVVVKDGNPDKVTETTVADHCKATIAGYKCPRKVIIRTEPLPMSGAGKVLKTELRKPFWGDRQVYSKDNDRTTKYV